MAGSQAYKALLDEAWSQHQRKNAGYAGEGNPDPWANFRMSEAFGVSAFDGCLVRMSDKYIRVTNLRKNPANDQVNESIRDTLLDLAAYAFISVCLMDEAIDKANAEERADSDRQTRPVTSEQVAAEQGIPLVADPSLTVEQTRALLRLNWKSRLLIDG